MRAARNAPAETHTTKNWEGCARGRAAWGGQDSGQLDQKDSAREAATHKIAARHVTARWAGMPSRYFNCLHQWHLCLLVCGKFMLG